MTAGSFLRRRIRALVEPAPGVPRRLPAGAARGVRLEGDPTLPLDLWLGLFESELLAFIREYCRPGARCVDVGSYNGYYALVFANLGASRVRAYDADPAARERISRNLELNPALAPAIEWSSAAVGATATGSGQVTLDADLADWGGVDLLKIDVEGAEHEVLAGARSVMSEARPHVIVETHSPGLEAACAEELLEHGYRPLVLTQRRILAQNRPGEHNRWLVAAGEGWRKDTPG